MVVGNAGGNAGRPGICLIMGTGAVAYGRNGARAHKSGGWGWKEGDCGSAYWMGV